MLFLRSRLASGYWPVISKCGLEDTIRFERANSEANQGEGRKTNRYRTRKDAIGKGGSLDTAADTQGSPASIRQTGHVEDANLGCGAASVTDDINIDYSQKGWGGVTP